MPSNRLTGYTVEKIPPDKNYAIWGLFEPNIISKICILQRPKWITPDKFEEMLRHLRLDGITGGFFEEMVKDEN